MVYMVKSGAKGGTIIRKKGENVFRLYARVGFNISLEPGFSPSRLCWMLAYGGIYAVANLRCCHMLALMHHASRTDNGHAQHC